MKINELGEKGYFLQPIENKEKMLASLNRLFKTTQKQSSLLSPTLLDTLA